jgi:hypothetical protein
VHKIILFSFKIFLYFLLTLRAEAAATPHPNPPATSYAILLRWQIIAHHTFHHHFMSLQFSLVLLCINT